MKRTATITAIVLLSLAATSTTEAVDTRTSDPSAGSAYTYDPPPWFAEGKKLIERRGGKCEVKEITEKEETFGEIRVSKSEDCNHLIPRAVAEQFGQNPARGEICAGGATEVTPDAQPGSLFYEGEGYSYTCRVFARPGTNAKPNRASWPCRRSVVVGDTGGSLIDRRWIAEKTKHYRRQTFSTLKRCLSQRLRRRR